jgi:hypothetical protein
VVTLGFALLYRAADTDDERTRLEDWVTYGPDELAQREQERRRAMAAQLGAVVQA